MYTVYDAYLTNEQFHALLGDLLTMVVLTAFLPILSFLFLPTTEGSTWNMEVEQEVVNVSRILDQFMIGYDKRIRPNYGGIPVTVGVSLYILSISELSEKNMDFTFDMYFRQFWHDPRLAFERRPGFSKLVLGADYVKRIWVPDTFFVNEKEASVHEITTENQFLRILPSGDVLRSIRLTIKASCPLDLQYFPMDKQMCTLEIESFGFTMSDLRFKWEDGPRSVRMSPDVSLPQFDVLGHRQRLVEVSLSSGNYSRLCVDVQFDRAIGHYVIQVYIPSSLIVVMSWINFWLDRRDVGARVGLGVTTVLTMTAMMAGVNSSMPKISYMKSLDIYLTVCFFMVFSALVEYACVGYMTKRIQLWKKRFLAVQKITEEKKAEAEVLQCSSRAGKPNSDTHPKSGLKAPDQSEPSSIIAGEPEPDRPVKIQLHPGLENPKRFEAKEGEFVGQDGDGEEGQRIPGGGCAPEGGSLLPAPVPLQAHPEKFFGMKPSHVDNFSRIAFPITFVGFHLMYWSYYLTVSNTIVQDLVYLD